MRSTRIRKLLRCPLTAAPPQFVVGIALLGIAHRAYSLVRYWMQPDQHMLDFEDGDIARNLVAGRGYVAGPGWVTPEFAPTAHKPPAYPLLIYTSIRLFGGSQVPLTILNLALMACIPILLYLLMRHCADETIARISAMIFLLSPVNAFRHISLTNTPLATFLLLVFLLVGLSNWPKQSALRSLILGCAFGLTLLTLPTLAVFGIPVFWKLLRERPAVLKIALPSLAIAILILVPWTVRNYVVFGELVPVGSSLPLEFAIGNSPDANGGLVHDDGSPVVAVRPELRTEAAARGLNEVQAYRLYGSQALSWSRENLDRFAVLRARSLFFFFVPQELLYFWFGPREAVFLGFSIALTIGTLIGIPMAWRRYPNTRAPITGLLLFVAIYTVTHANVNARYREPVDPLLAALLGTSIVVAFRRLTRQRAQNALNGNHD